MTTMIRPIAQFGECACRLLVPHGCLAGTAGVTSSRLPSRFQKSVVGPREPGRSVTSTAGLSATGPGQALAEQVAGLAGLAVRAVLAGRAVGVGVQIGSVCGSKMPGCPRVEARPFAGAGVPAAESAVSTSPGP